MKPLLSFALVSIACAAAACGPVTRSGNNNGDGGSNGNGDGGVVGVSCSSDLHGILDGNGNVIGTCPDTEGCSGGICVPACQAAATSQGSVGCDFVVATPSFYATDLPPCFAVFLANNWPTDTTITISRDGVTYDPATFGRVPDGTPDAASWPPIPTTGVATGSVGVLFLSSDPNATNLTPTTCPITPAVATAGGAAVYSGSTDSTGIGTAFHITTSVPVSGYDIMPYGGASSYLPSAELLLPTSAWGTSYIAGGPNPTGQSGNGGPGWGQLTAATDNTTIQITPTDTLPGGTGVAGAPAGATTAYTLNAGQFIQWQDAGDMSGSVITSSSPVAFTGGTGYLCVTSDTSTQGGGCDSGHQQIPPVSALGSEYVIPPYATRRADLLEESINYRFVGTAAGTTLTYSPAVPGAPTTIGLGEVAEFQAVGPFTVTSQDAMHPFYVGQYMSGCLLDAGSRPGANDPNEGDCLGDEEFVNILPPAQWLSSYVFFTDPTYTTTNLVLVRKAGAGGFADVTVDCLGTISGWAPVGDGTEYEITNVDLQRITPVGTCTNGRHTASSGGAFTIMVWGLASFASYAYPAGGNVGKINSVVIIN